MSAEVSGDRRVSHKRANGKDRRERAEIIGDGARKRDERESDAVIDEAGHIKK